MKLYIKDGAVKSRKTIVLKEDIDGEIYDVFNPDEDMILAAGWMPYEPEAVEAEIGKDTLYKNRIIELIKERYSTDDEIAILRQRDVKPEEFDEYNAYVESCKQTAYNEVYGGVE